MVFKGETGYIVGCGITQGKQKYTTSFPMANQCVGMAQKFKVDKYNHLGTIINKAIDKKQFPDDEPTK